MKQISSRTSAKPKSPCFGCKNEDNCKDVRYVLEIADFDGEPVALRGVSQISGVSDWHFSAMRSPSFYGGILDKQGRWVICSSMEAYKNLPWPPTQEVVGVK